MIDLADQNVQRRLAAILAADVVGYSSLMALDDEGTLARIKSLRHELIEPKVAEHQMEACLRRLETGSWLSFRAP